MYTTTLVGDGDGMAILIGEWVTTLYREIRKDLYTSTLSMLLKKSSFGKVRNWFFNHQWRHCQKRRTHKRICKRNSRTIPTSTRSDSSRWGFRVIVVDIIYSDTNHAGKAWFFVSKK